VIGIDNHDLAESFGLTTIAQDPRAQGRAAARGVLQEIGGAATLRRSISAPIRLVNRSSVATTG